MRLTYYLILFFAVVACSERDEITPVYSELPKDIGGLKELINSSDVSDTEKRAAYWELYQLTKQGDRELAKDYLNKVKELGEITGDYKSQGKAVQALGSFLREEGDYVSAVEHYLKSVELFENLDDPLYKADALNNLGVAFMETGNYEYATKFLDKANLIYSQKKDYPYVVKVNLNLGISYFSRQEPDYLMAEKHLQKALEITGSLIDKQDYYFNRIYNQIGVIKFQQADYAAAIHNYQLSLEYVGLGDDVKEKQSIAYANIGEAFMEQGNYTEAQRWLDKSMELSSNITYNKTLVDIHNMMAKLYQVQGEHEKAANYLEKAIAVADKDVINESLQETIDLLRVSYKFLQNSGKQVSAARYENAFAIDGQQDALEDELLQKANFKSLQAALGLSIELDNQIKEKKAEVEQREMISNIALSLGILLIIAAILGFVYTINYRRTKRDRDEWKDVCLEVRDVLESIPQ